MPLTRESVFSRAAVEAWWQKVRLGGRNLTESWTT